MARHNPKMFESKLVCKKCGAVMWIPRRIGYKREKHHIKDLWCFKCKAIEKFEEVGAV